MDPRVVEFGAPGVAYVAMDAGASDLAAALLVARARRAVVLVDARERRRDLVGPDPDARLRLPGGAVATMHADALLEAAGARWRGDARRVEVRDLAAGPGAADEFHLFRTYGEPTAGDLARLVFAIGPEPCGPVVLRAAPRVGAVFAASHALYAAAHAFCASPRDAEGASALGAVARRTVREFALSAPAAARAVDEARAAGILAFELETEWGEMYDALA